MASKFTDLVKEIILEIEQEELEETTTTGNVAVYDTPAAFSKPGQTKKKNDRLAKVSGGTVVDTLEEGERDYALGGVSTNNEKTFKQKPTAVKDIDTEMVADISGMVVAENRWLALKQDESTPRVKLAKGVSNIKKQLSEIETFLNWYSKIKNESGLTREEYWKRTNKNLHRIRERLMNISEKIRGL
jgi:hypothetical protein